VIRNNTSCGNTSGAYYFGNETITAENNLGFDTATNDDFRAHSGATGRNNYSGDGSAADAEWSSGSENGTGVTPATDLMSTTDTDGDNWLLPPTGSVLAGAGVDVTAHFSTYVNGVTIRATAVDVGAKGLAPSAGGGIGGPGFGFRFGI
jgi:hypothetical protein